MDNQLFTWALGGVGVVVTALTTVVMTLWKRQDKEYERLVRRHDECDEDRKELHRACGVLRGEMNGLKKTIEEMKRV